MPSRPMPPPQAARGCEMAVLKVVVTVRVGSSPEARAILGAHHLTSGALAAAMPDVVKALADACLAAAAPDVRSSDTSRCPA